MNINYKHPWGGAFVCHAQEHMAVSPTRNGLRFNSKGELVETWR